MGPFDAALRRPRRPAGDCLHAARIRRGAGFSLYDLSDRVRMRGWQIASYPLPADRQDTVVQRILVRHGVSRDMAGLLADDLRRALEHFKTHPAAASATSAPASITDPDDRRRSSSSSRPATVRHAVLRARLRLSSRPRSIGFFSPGRPPVRSSSRSSSARSPSRSPACASQIPDLVGRSSLLSSPTPSGYASGPQFVEGLRQRRHSARRRSSS